MRISDWSSDVCSSDLQCPQQVEAFYPPYNRWFENRVYPSADGLTIYFRDITERKRAEQLEASQHEILEGVAAQRPLAESLERIARLHETMNPGALCSLLLLDDDGRHVLNGAAPRDRKSTRLKSSHSCAPRMP